MEWNKKMIKKIDESEKNSIANKTYTRDKKRENKRLQQCWTKPRKKVREITLNAEKKEKKTTYFLI